MLHSNEHINRLLAASTGGCDSWIKLLQERAANSPDGHAFSHLSKRNGSIDKITYEGIHERASNIAVALRSYCSPNSRVLVALPSSHHYIASFFGAMYAGCIPVTAYAPNSNSNLSRIWRIAADCSPEAIIVSHHHMQSLTRSAEKVGYSGALVDIESVKDVGEQERLDIVKNCSSGDIAFLQYTSGSTASPKGVMVSHKNLLHNCELLKSGMAFTEESIVASWLPMHHDMGLIGKILCSIYCQVPCYYISPTDFLKSPYLWLKMISDYGCTISGAPNFAYDLCVKRVTEEQKSTLNLESWKVAWNGAEPVRKNTLNEFYDSFSNANLRKQALHPCYGLAEGTLFVTSKHVGELPVVSRVIHTGADHGVVEIGHDDDRPCVDAVSVGTPRLDSVVKIVSPDTKRECPNATVGELWVSSVSNAIGYWEKESETEETFCATLEGDSNRYMRTGDLAFSFQGEIYIAGRIKDVFILNGCNVYPQDIEETIETSHSQLARCCVFCNDCDGVESIQAVCELEKQYTQAEHAVLERICSDIELSVNNEHGMVLGKITLAKKNAIKKTTSGKVQRLATKEAYRDNELRVLHDWVPLTHVEESNDVNVEDKVVFVEDELNWFEVLKEEISKLINIHSTKINSNSRVSDLGLSSLQNHELAERLETRTGKTFEVSEFYTNNPTLRELATRIDGSVSTRANSVTGETNPHRLEVEESASHPSPALQGKQITGGNNSNLLVCEKFQQKVHNWNHPFISHVNPELGRKLSQLKLDKEYVRAEGLYLYDTDGNEYLDFLSQYGALPLGHNCPGLWDAVIKFRHDMDPTMVQPSLLSKAGALAKKLVELAPGDISYVTFCNSGAEAVEAAIKLSRSSTGRRKVLSTINGFHGKTLGALSATGRQKYRKSFFTVDDDFHHVAFNDIDSLEKVLRSREYCAFIVEPIQGEAGVILPSPGYLQKVQSICRETGTLFVVDEVQTGMGRTGSIYYSKKKGLQPDIITLSKGLSGGLVPVGACLSSRNVYDEEFAIKHTSTFAGNGLACAVALETLNILLADDGFILRQVNENGAKLKQMLLKMHRKYPHLIKEVRGAGLMLGLHISIDRYRFGSGLLAAVSEEEFITSLLMSYLLNIENVRVAFTLNDGNVLRIQPPLTVTWRQCEVFLDALDRTFEVLSQRNIAAMLRHVVEKCEPGPVASEIEYRDFVKSTQNGSNKYAFLLHPLTPRTYVDFDKALAEFNEQQLTRLGKVFGDNFDPFLGGEGQLASNTGQVVAGEFWVIPRTGKDFMEMPRRQALLEIEQAATKAVESGAKVIGLGAYTSTITQGGAVLDVPSDVVLTTGNSLTSLVAYLSVLEALHKRGSVIQESTIAVVGATGGIGRALSILFANCVKKLILVGNSNNHDASIGRMKSIVIEIIDDDNVVAKSMGQETGPLRNEITKIQQSHLSEKENIQRLLDTRQVIVSTNWDTSLPLADVVVTATNSPDDLIFDNHLRRNAIVCDVSRPSNVEESIASTRKDLYIYTGGVMTLPEGMELGLHTDLHETHCYACMAETMLITLEKSYALANCGGDIEIDKLPLFLGMMSRHGFGVYLPGCGEFMAHPIDEVADTEEVA